MLLAAAPAYASVFTVSSPNPTTAVEFKVKGEWKGNGSKDTFKLPELEFAIPLTRDLDFKIEAPYEWHYPHHGAHESGWGDAQIKSKWRFVHAGGFAMALYPHVKFATGDADRGLGEGYATLELPLVVGYRARHWEFGSELGYERVRHKGEAGAYWGFLVANKVTPALKLGAEWVTESPDAKLDRFDTRVDVGLEWEFSKPLGIKAVELELQALAGHSLHNSYSDAASHRHKVKLELVKKF